MAIMKTMNLNEFFTHKIIYKDTPLKFKDTLEQEISQASVNYPTAKAIGLFLASSLHN